jgi:hypothetical protein
MPTEHACALVSVDEVASATGQKTGSDPVDHPDGDNSICSWRCVNASADSCVTLVVGPMSPDAKKLVEIARTTATHVDDLGVPAYGIDDGQLGSADTELLVDAGSWFMSVVAHDPQLKVSQLIPIGKAALTH